MDVNMLDTVKTQSSDKIDDYGYRCRVWFHDWLPENRKVAEMFASLSLQAKRSGAGAFWRTVHLRNDALQG